MEHGRTGVAAGAANHSSAGLSYIALLKLGYVIDVYYRRIEPCRSPLTFATFVCFFPQLMAGPIPRARNLLPQFSEPRILSPEGAASGALTFLLGFTMKAFVANWLGPNVVDPVFGDSAHFSRAAHGWALLGYAVQVFCDFAGYSFLAIGTARLLGIELPENFRRRFSPEAFPSFGRDGTSRSTPGSSTISTVRSRRAEAGCADVTHWASC